ncbi:MAG: hypothetical protein IT306_03325 [Chloroflexi bacterium]|nr:hypothetical protein [Chloroflexota bacterium]
MAMHDQSPDLAPDPSLSLGPRPIEDAARAVEELIAELEPSLDRSQRRALHRLRLAAESLGMLRAATQALHVIPESRAF